MADFQALHQEFKSEGIKVIVGSADSIEKARETVGRLGIPYSVGYGMVAEDISRITGAYYNKEKKFLHATGFVVRPDKTIGLACYSTGPIGRLVARDALNLIKFLKSKK